ncbi:MAG: glycosyltransferase [Bacteroidia bacterium]|nr:glycosyltransferase [Bacteroidia bacterium]
MKISIITATYNSEAFLEQTINSILQQTYKDIEYIIVDGNSTDGTISIINKYKDKLSHFISEKDEGIYHALNKGIALASGDVIGFLHSDDFYTNNNVIEHVVKEFKTKNTDGLYANLYFVDKTDPNKITRKWHSGDYSPNSFMYGWMPPHPTLFLKKDVYKKYGTFNLDLKTSADYELMLRFIHKHQISLTYLDEFIIKMRVGGQSTASVNNRVKANLEDRKAWEINGLKPKFFTLWLKPLRKVGQFF